MNTNLNETAVVATEASADSRFDLSNIFWVAFGALTVAALWHYVNATVAAFTAIIPYLAGAMLFLTVLGSFYYLLGLFQVAREQTKYRVSALDAYTAAGVLTVMGYFSTACLHAFLGDSLALSHWNEGTAAAFLFTVGFGIVSFVSELWKSGSR